MVSNVWELDRAGSWCILGSSCCRRCRSIYQAVLLPKWPGVLLQPFEGSAAKQRPYLHRHRTHTKTEAPVQITTQLEMVLRFLQVQDT